MMTDNESARLEAVRRYDILDTPPDGAFDSVTALVAQLLDVPIAIVSIVDSDRIWFESHHGIDAQEVARDPGLCASAILQDGPWLISDAAQDPRTLANPLVAGSLGLRFYAGVPLRTHDGFNLGTLCAIDQRPREIDDKEVAALHSLADVVVRELELRLQARERISDEEVRTSDAQDEARNLQTALETNREIDKAIGMLMAFHRVSETEAFKIMSKASQDSNVRLSAMARDVIEHHNSRPNEVENA